MKRMNWCLALSITALAVSCGGASTEDEASVATQAPDWCSETTLNGLNETVRLRRFDADERVVHVTTFENGALVGENQTTYGELGIEATTFNAEQAPVYRYLIATREDGRPSQIIEEDLAGLGVETLSNHWIYDEAGQIETIETDFDSDGTVDHVEKIAHYAEGELAGQRYKLIDYTGQGVFSHRMTFDEDDQVVLEERDWDSDGSFAGALDQVIRTQYVDGDMTVRDVLFGDTPALHETWTYQDGVVVAYKQVAPSTGKVLRQADYAAAEGLRVTTERNEAGDMSMSEVEYDDVDGNPLLREQDSDGDGQPDLRITWSYDTHGRLLERREDSDGDGQPDVVLTWAYDEHDQIVRETEDANGDGTLDRIDEYGFFDAAQPAFERHDANGDGTWDEQKTWEYDGEQNLVRLAVQDAAGSRTTEYSYSCAEEAQ